MKNCEECGQRCYDIKDNEDLCHVCHSKKKMTAIGFTVLSFRYTIAMTREEYKNSKELLRLYIKREKERIFNECIDNPRRYLDD